MADKKDSVHKVPARTPEPRVGVGKQQGSKSPEFSAEVLEQAIRNADKVQRVQRNKPAREK
jgi:hypothetical protein